MWLHTSQKIIGGPANRPDRETRKIIGGLTGMGILTRFLNAMGMERKGYLQHVFPHSSRSNPGHPYSQTTVDMGMETCRQRLHLITLLPKPNPDTALPIIFTTPVNLLGESSTAVLTKHVTLIWIS